MEIIDYQLKGSALPVEKYYEKIDFFSLYPGYP
jgi:hypothetical protein